MPDRPACFAELQRVADAFPDLPYMSLRQAVRLARHLEEYDLRRCLELGSYQGKSAAFIAATLTAMGDGHLLTLDRREVLDRRPNVHEVLAALGLEDRVTVALEERSFTWRIRQLLKAHAQPCFDFCYFDGGHSWDVTGFAFLSVDPLIVPGGWILFDDLDWTYARMETPGRPLPGWLARMPEEERRTPQVREVWELLVKRHPAYDSFTEEGQWGWARKKP